MMEKIPDGIMIFFWCPHRVDEGRKGLKSSRDKKASPRAVWGERGEEPAMTPDLRYDQEGEKRRAKIINGMVRTRNVWGGNSENVVFIVSEKKVK